MNEMQYPPLEPNSVYHIFSHAVANNNLFVNNGNYNYFLHKWQKHTEGYMTTYAFCLMPNHFHFCIKTADKDTLIALETKRQKQKQEEKGILIMPDAKINISKNAFSNRIKNCLNAYTQAFNIQQKQEGTLFRSRFGRIKVNDRQYFRDLICYIHHNPIHHFGVDHYNEWAFSSYNMFVHPELFEETYGLNFQIVIDVFGSLQAFIDYHEDYRLKKKFVNIEKCVQNIVKN